MSYLLETNVCIALINESSKKVRTRFNSILVTANTREFERVKGLVVEDWTE
jgi:predicted nucleic acid-binding protein